MRKCNSNLPKVNDIVINETPNFSKPWYPLEEGIFQRGLLSFKHWCKYYRQFI